MKVANGPVRGHFHCQMLKFDTVKVANGPVRGYFHCQMLTFDSGKRTGSRPLSPSMLKFDSESDKRTGSRPLSLSDAEA